MRSTIKVVGTALAFWTAFSSATAATIPMYDLPVAGVSTGEVYKMSEHKNSVWVFEGMRLDCIYCNQNATNVDQLATSFAENTRVQVLDLCIDADRGKCNQWVAKHHPNHLTVQDVGRKIFMALKTQDVVPQAFVVDCNGNMVGNYAGYWDQSGIATMKSLVNKALETTCGQ